MLNRDATRLFSFPSLTRGLALSVLLHALLLAAIAHVPRQQSAQLAPIEVSLVLTPSEARTQIVAPAESLEQEPQVATNLRAERATATEQERVARGDAPDAGMPGEARSPDRRQSPRAARDRAPAPPEREHVPLRTLALDQETLRREFGEASSTHGEHAKQQPAGDNYRAFSRPAGSGARIVGLRGTNDHLPSLPDGDLTLLNAKAERHAVFVRRVATQVFSQLRASGWESLSAADINRLSSDTTVTASLSLQGKLLGVTMQRGSGSERFDRVVEEAVRRGARDPHPPAEAAADDGTIRFIFKARSWSEGGYDGRGAGLVERRWLLLATGLE